MVKMLQGNNLLTLLLVGGSVLGYGCFAYEFERTDFVSLFFIYSGLFLCFGGLLTLQKYNILLLSATALLVRLVLLVSYPTLSQDFYRFIWDGRMILNGYNPYLNTPEYFLSQAIFPVQQAKVLYDGMGELSAGNFTNYPPINQWSFVLAGFFSSNSILGAIIGMRVQLILADLGIFIVGSKLLKLFGRSPHYIFLYLLNPLVVIEVTGNLHYESMMLFFLLFSIYLLKMKRWQWAAVALAASVSVKLIPLIFLPLFFQQFTWKRLLMFYAIVLIVVFVTFLPFMSPLFVTNYAQTVGLWFQNFEFNASFYYLLRAIGYEISGYNQIAIIGKFLAFSIFVIVLWFSFFRKNNTYSLLLVNMLWVLTIYYFLSTTVHPWYLSSLVLLMSFTSLRFPLVWSFLVFLSYITYSSEAFQESAVLLFIQYVPVVIWLIWELVKRRAETV